MIQEEPELGCLRVLHLDNGEKEGFDVAGGVQEGVAALQDGQQQGPVGASAPHCRNVHLTPPNLQPPHPAHSF